MQIGYYFLRTLTLRDLWALDSKQLRWNRHNTLRRYQVLKKLWLLSWWFLSWRALNAHNKRILISIRIGRWLQVNAAFFVWFFNFFFSLLSLFKISSLRLNLLLKLLFTVMTTVTLLTYDWTSSTMIILMLQKLFYAWF